MENGKPFGELPIWQRASLIVGVLVLTAFMVVAVYGPLIL